MTDYARIINNTIERVGQPPAVAQLDDGNWVDLRQLDPTNLAAAGWVVVVEVPRPDDTDTVTWTSSMALVAGVPTRTWTEAPKPPVVPTPTEAAAAILDEAQTLDPLLPADLADILARAAAALRGES